MGIVDEDHRAGLLASGSFASHRPSHRALAGSGTASRGEHEAAVDDESVARYSGATAADLPLGAHGIPYSSRIAPGHLAIVCEGTR